MNDKDILQHFIFEHAPVRGEIIRLEKSFRTVMQQHQYPPVIQTILGEMLIAASLLSGSIKFKGRITVQFQGKGKLRLLLAQSNDELQLRGFAEWQGELTQEELITHLKEGVLVITINPEVDGGQQYQGIVAWQGNSLAHSIEGYFNTSEQLPTRVWFAVNDRRAAGFLIQMMPEESAHSSQLDHWEHITHLTSTLTSNELLNLDNEKILHRLYVEEDIRIFSPKPVIFRCTCSQTRSENALRLLGEMEVEQELTEKQIIIVTCEFCNKEFKFDRIDVARIFKRGNPGSSTQVH
ncbi:MAG TPA: Hsp33 family molecular chaperone HslO [Gammaproteobacteria bacterium]|nr:Hsp33 family molecular chaperone HslO [Gammaproteobacteria bacterium]